MSTNERIRGRQLQAIRADHFRLHPLCVWCKRDGRTRAATQLDHIVPIFKGGADIPSNRQGLCDSCHALKTAQDLGYSAKGCDEDGLPSDPLHPWNRKPKG